MNTPWRFFIIIEALLFVLALWQIMQIPGLAFLMLVGMAIIFYSFKKNPRTNFNRFQLLLGSLLIMISAINSPALCLMIVFAILFVGVNGIKISGIDITRRAPWRKRQIMMIETVNAEKRCDRRFKRPWFANERLGSNVYEWDDINIDILSGDTIIDLGNTLLPKNDSVIIIRKGVGRTRILVPLGTAILLEHSTFYGSVLFEDEIYHLKNESLKLYSSDFDTNQRRLKIITNALLGDIEVIRV